MKIYLFFFLTLAFKKQLNTNKNLPEAIINVNGISLTCLNITNDSFTVAIIPYTFENTNMNSLKKGDTVDIELDVVS